MWSGREFLHIVRVHTLRRITSEMYLLRQSLPYLADDLLVSSVLQRSAYSFKWWQSFISEYATIRTSRIRSSWPYMSATTLCTSRKLPTTPRGRGVSEWLRERRQWTTTTFYDSNSWTAWEITVLVSLCPCRYQNESQSVQLLPFRQQAQLRLLVYFYRVRVFQHYYRFLMDAKASMKRMTLHIHLKTSTACLHLIDNLNSNISTEQSG